MKEDEIKEGEGRGGGWFFFFKQKTAYEIKECDWSSDVCSSDLQATVITVNHVSTKYKTLNFHKFCKDMKIPVIIGNCVTYHTALELMETGCSGLLEIGRASCRERV